MVVSGESRFNWARESGAHVTAFVRDYSASQELLRGLGAAEVVETISGDFDPIVDAVGGATFGFRDRARRSARHRRQSRDPERRNRYLPRSRVRPREGARIYRLNLLDELASHASAAGDLTRLCKLMADGLPDDQIELEGSWREPAQALDAAARATHRRQAVLHVD
jgi:hypothetical protein